MADSLNCSPCYEGRPDYDPNGGTAILPIENITRSRLFAGGTFFRSKLNYGGDNDFQGSICNEIELQVSIVSTTVTLNVYFEDELVESYTTSQGVDCGSVGPGDGGEIITYNAIGKLRSLTSSSKYITMPARGTDEEDPSVRLGPGETGAPADALCIDSFGRTNMKGGSGPGANNLTSIRTGPDRTIVFIRTKENANGEIIEPGAGNNLQQWDYDAEAWIPFIQDADCALPADRCP